MTEGLTYGRDPPPPPNYVIDEGKTRDEQTLRQEEQNEPLELVSLNPNHPKNTMRSRTKKELEMRWAMKQLLTQHRDVFP